MSSAILKLKEQKVPSQGSIEKAVKDIGYRTAYISGIPSFCVFQCFHGLQHNQHIYLTMKDSSLFRTSSTMLSFYIIPKLLTRKSRKWSFFLTSAPKQKASGMLIQTGFLLVLSIANSPKKNLPKNSRKVIKNSPLRSINVSTLWTRRDSGEIPFTQRRRAFP